MQEVETCSPWGNEVRPRVSAATALWLSAPPRDELRPRHPDLVGAHFVEAGQGDTGPLFVADNVFGQGGKLALGQLG